MRKSSYSDISAFPVEMRLILSYLRRFFSNKGGGYIENVPMEGIDWDIFLSCASRHRVIPFLTANSEGLAANACPEKVLKTLRENSERNVWNNLLLAVELVHLSDLFEQKNIPCIAIKGTAQALLLYGNLELRSSSDIDLLVPPQAVGVAHQELLRSGYILESKYTAHSFIEAVRKRVMHHYCYRHNVTGIIVELHWRLALYRSVLGIHFDTILENAQVVRIGNREVKTLSDEHMTLLLFWHGAVDKWDTLSKVCDVAQIFRGLGTLDCTSLLMEGSRLGVCRSVVAGLILSNLLLGSPLPDEIRLAAERDTTVCRLIHYVTRRLLPSHTGGSGLASVLGETRYWMRLGRKLRYKMEVAVTTPGRVACLRQLGIG